jgi:hypothetical protein
MRTRYRGRFPQAAPWREPFGGHGQASYGAARKGLHKCRRFFGKDAIQRLISGIGQFLPPGYRNMLHCGPAFDAVMEMVLFR